MGHNMSDAFNRFARTVLQSIAVAALTAAVTVAHDALSAGRTDYSNIAKIAGGAALVAVVAYIHRRWVDPSRIPSLKPWGDDRPKR